MHHEGDMRWRRPRRCLRVELVNVTPCWEGKGVTGVLEITEESESGWVRATESGGRRGHKRVAGSFYRGTVVGTYVYLPGTTYRLGIHDVPLGGLVQLGPNELPLNETTLPPLRPTPTRRNYPRLKKLNGKKWTEPA